MECPRWFDVSSGFPIWESEQCKERKCGYFNKDYGCLFYEIKEHYQVRRGNGKGKMFQANYFWMCFDFPEMTCQKCRGAGMILKKGAMYPVKCDCLTTSGRGSRQ